MPSAEPTVDADVLTIIAIACRDHERVRFDYRSHDGSDSRRDVEPHRLVNDGRRWYLVAWDTDRNDWRTFRADRIAFAANYRGPRFTPREPSEGDVATHVARGVGAPTWNSRAHVTAHASAEELIARQPPALRVDPLDEQTCRIEVGSDTPQMLAVYLGMLDVDFDIEVDAHPEVAEHLHTLADRFGRAIARDVPVAKHRRIMEPPRPKSERSDASASRCSTRPG
jgi:predicted DNA-binding transcriptional regulator YafY